MSTTPRLLGAVLAGGTSRRFGRDKALEVLKGLTLLERAVETLGAVCESGIVVSSVPRIARWPCVPDGRSGAGPLAAIETALEEAERRAMSGVLVLACDLPLVTAGTLRALAVALGSDAAAVPAKEGVPHIEPLCAAYALAALPAAHRLLDAGERSAYTLFHEVTGIRVPLAEDEFLNVNTDEDFQLAERALAARALLNG